MMQNKIFILSLIVCLLVLMGCEDRTQFRTKKRVVQLDNYAEIQYSQTDNPADYADPDKFKIKLVGNVNGINFEEYLRGDNVGAFDLCIWNDDIILAAVQGFAIYSTMERSMEWIFIEKNISIYSLVQFDVDNGKIYSVGSVFPDMKKKWIAIDIEKKSVSKFDVEGEDITKFSLTTKDNGATAKTDKGSIFIKALDDGKFKFITEE